jgi:uncharacterized protein YheU (UPF0270 family)
MSEWWDDEREQQEPVAVPYKELSEEALRGVVESFVLREGTDYGARDVPHEQKVAQVIRQLERGEARIMFDPVSQSVAIVVAKQQGVTHVQPSTDAALE